MKLTTKLKIITAVLLVLAAGIYYYIEIPAFNFHSLGTWEFVIAGILVLLILYGLHCRIRSFQEFKDNKGTRIGVLVILTLIVILIIGSIFSSPIVNASRYQKLLTVEDRDFSQDITEVDYSKIPLLDKSSAAILGNRKMGSMSGIRFPV